MQNPASDYGIGVSLSKCGPKFHWGPRNSEHTFRAVRASDVVTQEALKSRQKLMKQSHFSLPLHAVKKVLTRSIETAQHSTARDSPFPLPLDFPTHTLSFTEKQQ